MALIADRVLDGGLTILDTEVNKLCICSAEPTTYTEANSTYLLGAKTSPTVGSPEDASPNGRKVVVSAITDGAISANGTASHWALVDTGNSRLLAAGSLSSTQAVTNGNVFTLTAIDIRIPDAA